MFDKNDFINLKKLVLLEQKIKDIKSEMFTILLTDNGIDGSYRPIKNTSKRDCYEVLGKIQEILRTNRI